MPRVPEGVPFNRRELAVWCPNCEADPGEPCYSEDGSAYVPPHAQRQLEQERLVCLAEDMYSAQNGTPPPADEIEELNAPYEVDESRYGVGGGCPSPDAEPYAHLPWHERVEAVRESNQRAGGDNYGG